MMKQKIIRAAFLIKKRSDCREKFLSFFPQGFVDPKYLNWERNYKWSAHLNWKRHLNKAEYERLLKNKKYQEIAQLAIRIESKTNLLFSFEKMALRDAVKTPASAKLFAEGLYSFIYGTNKIQTKIEHFSQILGKLPRKQTRLLTWPLTTVFGFIASPKKFIFLKPMVTKRAAHQYGFNLEYLSRPNWETYSSLLNFTKQIKYDLADLNPKDYIDLQSFIWILGSEEYE